MNYKNLSPLRYPGGKAKLTNFIIDLVKLNNLTECSYIEPFAGGAGAALALLANGIVGNIIINDYDTCIFAFWHSVLYETEKFCELIKLTPVTMREWYKQRDIYNNAVDLLELGFATFFLNRTNRSGIIKAGPIGGYEQQGSYKIDCRFNKDDLVNRINTIALYKEKISLFNLDASEFIKSVLLHAPENSLVYLDPPYYKKGPGLYTNFYNDEDHKNLAESIKEYIRQPWILTYDSVEEISVLYEGYHQTEYFLNYSVSNKYKGKEILVYSNNIIPIVSSNLEQCI
ncbi:MAG: DNA adenine methylase [Bacillota bacterium]